MEDKTQNTEKTSGENKIQVSKVVGGVVIIATTAFLTTKYVKDDFLAMSANIVGIAAGLIIINDGIGGISRLVKK